MAVIGNLAVAVTANTIGLSRGLGGATTLVSGFGSKLAGLTGIVAPIGAALAGLAASMKGIMEVGEAFGDIDRIAKAADSFGITTEEMVGLEHAAELSGVSTEALGKALQRATRQGMTLPDIADRLANMDDPAERAAFAYKTLGRQGQDLIPLLAAGGDAIREMMAEGNELAGFSRIDASKVEEANDAISRMKLAFSGVARDIAISLAPVVERVAVGVRVLGEWTRQAFTNITPIIEQTGNVAVSMWNTVWTAAQGVFGGLFSGAQTTFAGIADVVLDALIVAEFGFTNLPAVAELVWGKLRLGALTFSEDVRHLFGVVLPSAVKGFAVTVGKVLPEVWEFIKSGGQTDITDILKPLEEGLINTIARLPERALSPFEQKLQAKIGKMEGALTGDLAEFIATRRDELLGTGGMLELPELSLDIPETLSTGQQEQQGPAALQRGSSEAFSAILSAMRGDRKDPQQEVAANTELMLAEQRRQTQELRKLARGGSLELVTGSA